MPHKKRKICLDNTGRHDSTNDTDLNQHETLLFLGTFRQLVGRQTQNFTSAFFMSPICIAEDIPRRLQTKAVVEYLQSVVVKV